MATLTDKSRFQIKLAAAKAGMALSSVSDDDTLIAWCVRQNAMNLVETTDGRKPEAKTEKKVKAEKPAASALEAAIRVVVEEAVSEIPQGLDEDRIIDLIKQYSAAPLSIEIRHVERDVVKVIDRAHKQFTKVLNRIRAGLNVYLVGPAGSGKTTLCEQVATALDIPFYFDSKLTMEHKLEGFVNAKGECVSTNFRKAFVDGGLYLADEIDAWGANASVWMNAAAANRTAAFPDGTFKAHPNFVLVAAGNTFGRGGDRQYVGRNQLDAATLDRFAFITVDYDEDLERAIAVAEYQNKGGEDIAVAGAWVEKVQQIRRNVERHNVRHVVSPRASIMGCAILATGGSLQEALEETVYKGLPEDVIAQITA